MSYLLTIMRGLEFSREVTCVPLSKLNLYLQLYFHLSFCFSLYLVHTQSCLQPCPTSWLSCGVQSLAGKFHVCLFPNWYRDNLQFWVLVWRSVPKTLYTAYMCKREWMNITSVYKVHAKKGTKEGIVRFVSARRTQMGHMTWTWCELQMRK